MKRSEMIDLIEDEVTELIGTSTLFDYTDANILLIKMEKAGMLPPPYTTWKFGKDGYKEYLGEDEKFMVLEHIGKYSDTGWEPEDNEV